MSRPTSQRKLAANRRNANKSTGPKTPRGKARSSRNALKHGLLSTDVVVTTRDNPERLRDFHALIERLTRQYDPQDAVEQALVERVAACFWRLRRALRFEVGAISQSLDNCANHSDNQELAKLDQELHRAHASRTQLAEYLRFLKGFDPNDSEAVSNAGSTLSKIRLRFSGDVWESPLPEMCQVLLRKLPDYLGEIEKQIPDIKRRFERAHESAALRRERRLLTAALPAPDEVLKLVRYENMLDRQLHRALTQLDRRRQRRHQSETPPQPPE